MRKGFGQYDAITHESDGRGDFFDDMGKRAEKQDSELRNSVLSSRWSRGKRKSEEAERIIYDLLQIRDTVAGLMRVHGLQKGTIVKIALLGQIGKGAAGFADIGTWQKPHVFLDAGIYKNCSDENVLDVYCGIGLHAASHLNHTRRYYERMNSGSLPPGTKRCSWEGLFEDERIEEKVREESPGFAPYLQALKRALFDDQEFGAGLRAWDRQQSPLCDLDRVNLLIFGFIRCGYALTDEMRQWTTITGCCVFEELRDLFPAVPESEEVVEEYGARLEKWYDEILKEYEDKREQQEQREQSGEGSGGGEIQGDGDDSSDKSQQSPQEPDTGDQGQEDSQSQSEVETPAQDDTEDGAGDSQDQPSPDDGTEVDGKNLESPTSSQEQSQGCKADGQSQAGGNDLEQSIKDRLDQQQQMDEQDAKVSSAERALERLLKNESSTLKLMANEEAVSKTAQEGKWAQKVVESFEEQREVLEKQIATELAKREEQGRFGLKDLHEMLKRVDTITKPLDKEESEKMAEASAERVELGPEWRPDNKTVPQRAVIVHPQTSQKVREKYANYLRSVKDDVAKMRQVFRLRLGTRRYCETQRKEGRLHRRMLGRAMQSDRLFKREYSRTDKGIAICLLLDESGSMSIAGKQPSSSKASTALRMAILIAEALKNVSGVELEIYSFTTCGVGSHDTLFKYLYGKNNAILEGLANYGKGKQNYDYQAIAVAVEQFKKYTENENRLLIVLSDGAPCGMYGGHRDAETATKMSVDAARKGGVRVLQVAIEDYRESANIYGARNVIKFTDIPRLVTDMRKFITSIVKNTTEGR